jgi:hypothetical protein
MSTHTVGPWTFKYEPQSDGSAEAFEIHAHGATLIGACSCCNGAFISDDAEGNARLIAAAPDLLDALELIVKDKVVSEDGEFGKVVFAAIAKARGES